MAHGVVHGFYRPSAMAALLGSLQVDCCLPTRHECLVFSLETVLYKKYIYIERERERERERFIIYTFRYLYLFYLNLS